MNMPNETIAGLSQIMPDEEAIRTQLKKVVDPEMSINIVDLGLIYRVDVAPQHVRIDLTMTSPACPVAQMIVDDVCDELDKLLPEGCELDIELVWNPPWGPEMMSERSRRALGWAD